MKIEELQKQLNALEKEMAKLQSEITKAKAATKPIFHGLDPDITTIDEVERRLQERTDFGADFSIRILGEYAYQGFFLGDSKQCDWEIVQDEHFCWVLKLKEKQ